MPLPPDVPELTREAIEKRMQELDALPDAGKLAKRLREQRGLSQRSLARTVGVMPRDIMMVEREGRVRVLRDPRLRGPCVSVVPGEAQDDTKLEKFLTLTDFVGTCFWARFHVQKNRHFIAFCDADA